VLEQARRAIPADGGDRSPVQATACRVSGAASRLFAQASPIAHGQRVCGQLWSVRSAMRRDRRVGAELLIGATQGVNTSRSRRDARVVAAGEMPPMSSVHAADGADPAPPRMTLQRAVPWNGASGRARNSRSRAQLHHRAAHARDGVRPLRPAVPRGRGS
jgi:hypothetical protein